MPIQNERPILPGCTTCGAELYPAEHAAGETCFACQKRAAAPDQAQLDEQGFANLIGWCLNPETSDEAQGALMTFMEQGEFEVRSFADAGLITGNNGIVVRLGGAEFQITVVRSR